MATEIEQIRRDFIYDYHREVRLSDAEITTVIDAVTAELGPDYPRLLMLRRVLPALLAIERANDISIGLDENTI